MHAGQFGHGPSHDRPPPGDLSRHLVERGADDAGAHGRQPHVRETDPVLPVAGVDDGEVGVAQLLRPVGAVPRHGSAGGKAHGAVDDVVGGRRPQAGAVPRRVDLDTPRRRAERSRSADRAAGGRCRRDRPWRTRRRPSRRSETRSRTRRRRRAPDGRRRRWPARRCRRRPGSTPTRGARRCRRARRRGPVRARRRRDGTRTGGSRRTTPWRRRPPRAPPARRPSRRWMPPRHRARRVADSQQTGRLDRGDDLRRHRARAIGLVRLGGDELDEGRRQGLGATGRVHRRTVPLAGMAAPTGRGRGCSTRSSAELGRDLGDVLGQQLGDGVAVDAEDRSRARTTCPGRGTAPGRARCPGVRDRMACMPEYGTRP